MSAKTMIACALTGSADITRKNPAVPVTPEQIARSGIEAANAGAAIVHIHVRDPATGKPSMALELYREAVNRIRSSGVDVIINLTTGAGARFVPDRTNPKIGDATSTLTTPQQRVRHILALKPEICSLDLGSINMGPFVFINTVPHVEEMAAAIRDAGVLPELEVFDPSHVMLAQQLVDSGHVKPSPLVQICLGVNGGAPATSETMIYMRSLLPKGTTWFSFGVGRQQFPMVAQAVLLGGNVRVGLEDNLYLGPGRLAPSNAALVEKAVGIIRSLGGDIASAAEARATLNLRGAETAAANDDRKESTDVE
jgi:uncharacterized protein (DUF849 family)